VMASTTSCMTGIVKQGETIIFLQPANMDASAPSQSHGISKAFLAGAVSLGLRRSREKSASGCLAHQNMHPMSTEFKGEVCADETSTKNKLQRWLKDSNKVPRAPSKPPPDGSRKRPQMRGVPMLTMCAN